MKNYKVSFSDDHLPDEQFDYLESCARIRGIALSALLRRLVVTIARDQLVLSILDDETDYGRKKSERQHPSKMYKDYAA